MAALLLPSLVLALAMSLYPVYSEEQMLACADAFRKVADAYMK